MSQQAQKMGAYYRFHAKIYQATRWSFLFGRKAILEKLDIPKNRPTFLVEIGCGTGHNISILAKKYPQLQCLGIDISADMLAVARKRTHSFGERVQFLEQNFGAAPLSQHFQPPDFILISYCLTMINPGWEAVLDECKRILPPHGRVAVVDFHHSRWQWFRWWMSKNHVCMEKHLLPALQRLFPQNLADVRKAYFGWWEYFLFVGGG